MNCYQDFYRGIARAFRFQGNHRLEHKLAGTRQLQVADDPTDEAWISAAEESAWHIIYRWHYLRERPVAGPELRPLSMREREDPEFAARLVAADSSQGVFDQGWAVVSRDNGACTCEKDGLRLRVPAVAEPGESIVVRFPAGRRHWMPDYYSTGGGISPQIALRVYFNVKPDWAPWLLRTVSGVFGHAHTGYQFKLLNHPRHYTRPDAAVLYVGSGGIDATITLLREIASSRQPAFRARVPELTLRLEPGIALADEPPKSGRRSMSFGENRSRLLARALARAHADGSGCVEAIQNEFALQQLDPARPYAAAGGNSLADFLNLRYHQSGAKTA